MEAIFDIAVFIVLAEAVEEFVPDLDESSRFVHSRWESIHIYLLSDDRSRDFCRWISAIRAHRTMVYSTGYSLRMSCAF